VIPTINQSGLATIGPAEIGSLDGVTSNIQAQLDSKSSQDDLDDKADKSNPEFSVTVLDLSEQSVSFVEELIDYVQTGSSSLFIVTTNLSPGVRDTLNSYYVREDGVTVQNSNDAFWQSESGGVGFADVSWNITSWSSASNDLSSLNTGSLPTAGEPGQYLSTYLAADDDTYVSAEQLIAVYYGSAQTWEFTATATVGEPSALTISSNEVGYLDGVTSNIQGQLDGHSHNASAITYTVEGKSADYTIVAADAGKVIRSTASSAITMTIEDVLSIGEVITFVQYGLGQVTFASSSTATIVSVDSKLKTNKRYSTVQLMKTEDSFFDSNIMQDSPAKYLLFGDIAA
jgi:hypothetical protein